MFFKPRRSLIIFLTFFVCAKSEERQKRYLIYPRSNPTRLQFVAGFGIPYDSNVEAITSGYVIRTQHFMPFNATQLLPLFLNNRTIDVNLLEQGIFNTVKRSVRSNEEFGMDEKYVSEVEVVDEGPLEEAFDSANFDSRWNFYDIISAALVHKGFDGKVCLLRAICEAVKVKFSHQSGILGELLHVILSPSTSDESMNRHFDYEYHFAEQTGERGEECEHLFRDCPISILDLFTGIHEF